MGVRLSVALESNDVINVWAPVLRDAFFLDNPLMLGIE